MMSEWRVSSNPIDGRKFYRAYRIRDLSEPDHSGNREYHGNYVESREDAAATAAALNKEAEQK